MCSRWTHYTLTAVFTGSHLKPKDVVLSKHISAACVLSVKLHICTLSPNTGDSEISSFAGASSSVNWPWVKCIRNTYILCLHGFIPVIVFLSVYLLYHKGGPVHAGGKNTRCKCIFPQSIRSSQCRSHTESATIDNPCGTTPAKNRLPPIPLFSSHAARSRDLTQDSSAKVYHLYHLHTVVSAFRFSTASVEKWMMLSVCDLLWGAQCCECDLPSGLIDEVCLCVYVCVCV